MYSKCIKCEQEDILCIVKLILLPPAELIKWIIATKKKLGWTIPILSERSGIPVGTISRVLSEEADCKYYTMRCLVLALLEGLGTEFRCRDVAPSVQHLELLTQQAGKLHVFEKENEELRVKLAEQEERHRNDIRIIRSEYQAQLADRDERIVELKEDKNFYKEQLKAWQSR